MRNLQEQVKKAFCYQKLFWPFTVWINCSSDLKNFADSRPSASNFKIFSRSLEQFFLTVGLNNFYNKIQFFWLHCELLASSTQLEKIIAKSVKFSWANTSIQCVRSTEYFFQRHTVVNISHRIKNRPYFTAR